jgi:hypothetical protein
MSVHHDLRNISGRSSSAFRELLMVELYVSSTVGPRSNSIGEPHTRYTKAAARFRRPNSSGHSFTVIVNIMSRRSRMVIVFLSLTMSSPCLISREQSQRAKSRPTPSSTPYNKLSPINKISQRIDVPSPLVSRTRIHPLPNHSGVDSNLDSRAQMPFYYKRFNDVICTIPTKRLSS